MKTPREILLARHHAAQPKLDAIRREAVAGMEGDAKGSYWFELVRSLRWHLVGLGAVWLFILLLHVETGGPTAMMASVPSTKAPNARIIMASLRENRRQVSEIIEPVAADIEHRDATPPKPHSEARTGMLVA